MNTANEIPLLVVPAVVVPQKNEENQTDNKNVPSAVKEVKDPRVRPKTNVPKIKNNPFEMA